MDGVHRKLLDRIPLYRRWHGHPSHSAFHWFLFFLAAAVFSYGFAGQPEAGQSRVFLRRARNAVFIERTTAAIARPASDRILVKFKDEAGPEQRAAALARHGFEERSEIAGIGVRVVSIPVGKVPEQAAAEFFRAESSAVLFAEPDVLLPPELVPNDPWFANQQKDKQQVNAPAAWDVTTGEASHVIAIADTGVDCAHEDLVGRCVPGWNFFDGNNDARDVYGHGTKVAGVAAATGGNALGIAGMAWKPSIMPLRVSGTDGYASYSTIASAVTYAADKGAKVVNNSYKSGGSATVRSAADYLLAKGGILVVSQGNDGGDSRNSASASVVSVSAVDVGDTMYAWSSYGGDVDIAAPGCTGATTANYGGYTSFCGTSNAAPEVSGALMLVFAANPSLSAAQARDALLDSAKDFGPVGWDDRYGWGRLDAAAAVAASGPIIVSPPPSPGAVKIISYQVATKSATSATISWTTNIASSGSVAYGTTTALANVAASGATSTSHSVTLTGLTRNTRYYFAITAKGADGATTDTTATANFRTRAK